MAHYVYAVQQNVCVCVCVCVRVCVCADSAEQHKHNASSEYVIPHTQRVL